MKLSELVEKRISCLTAQTDLVSVTVETSEDKRTQSFKFSLPEHILKELEWEAGRNGAKISLYLNERKMVLFKNDRGNTFSKNNSNRKVVNMKAKTTEIEDSRFFPLSEIETLEDSNEKCLVLNF